MFGKRRDVNLVGAILLGVGSCCCSVGPGGSSSPRSLFPLAFLVLVGVLLWRAAGGARCAATRRGSSRASRSRSLIGIAALGGFIAVFVAAALGGGTVLAALAVVAGVALVATAFVGGARWLIVPALVLVLPLAIVAAADIDVKGGVGERHYRPATMAEVHDCYRLGVGELVVDLRDVDLPAGPHRRRARRRHRRRGRARARERVRVVRRRDRRRRRPRARPRQRRRRRRLRQRQRAAGEAPQVHVNADIGVGALQVRRGETARTGTGTTASRDRVEPACP